MDSRPTLQTQLDYFTYNQRHWLIPRTGELISACLTLLGVDRFQLWRYWEGPSHSYARPTFDIPVDSATRRFLTQQWRNEASGFQFPEEALVPVETDEDLFIPLSNYCRQLVHQISPSKGSTKSFAKALRRQPWIIFPLAVSPFMAEAPTDYCLVLLQDERLHEFIRLELSEHGNLFSWENQTPAWPIPQESEELAQALWDQELSETA